MAEDEITHLADPIHDSITREVLAAHTGIYYGTRRSPAAFADNLDPSIVLYVDGNEVLRTDVVACNLSTAWAHVPPAGKYAIDPVLGRIAIAADLPVPQSARLHFPSLPVARAPRRQAPLIRVGSDPRQLHLIAARWRGYGTIDRARFARGCSAPSMTFPRQVDPDCVNIANSYAVLTASRSNPPQIRERHTPQVTGFSRQERFLA